MSYKFTFRPIARKFLQPLVTSYGNWEKREAIIISLTDEQGRVGWGEIAPISWFGSETLEQALDFCHQLPQTITQEIILAIPDELSACQFGFESALAKLQTEETFISHTLTYSGLLTAGEGVLNQWRGLWKQGYRTFKWKIGVGAIATELDIFHSLMHSLPPTAKLRLDANGGLSCEQTKTWLETCDNHPDKIEFIEQPLPVEQFSQMLVLNECYTTAIALDESVATLKQLTEVYHQGWRGIFVIKPAIIGSPSRLRNFCQQYKIDAVFSSVLETEIGRQAALQLAVELSAPNRAVGFGINHFFVAE
ncbi:o-succinylbenzoate synthase [Fortiea contorta]|uniref:o-succinylbenzoate synthase n=1 Tax=Fortiea contorta TaxID=1892405 RepID=UPI000348F8FC|nr:o-succinylbenzoate synthase [Fortiea contorta]